MAPEPAGKLDAAASESAALAVDHAAGVNGPHGDDLDWDAVDWRAVEDDVRRLRRRIFKASQVGDFRRVRSLQKLMLRSYANTLVSVRRVAQRNAGRATAGIDGEVALTSPERAALAVDVHRRQAPWRARPVKRVYIPKGDGKQRPLGIPVLRDRVLQARVVNALEPEWEARLEPRCYGFRPGRGCHDAIEAIYWTLKGRRSKRQWVFDADLTAAFDRIDHDRLLASVGGFPARGLIAGWLRAGAVEQGQFTPTEEGTPQGGVVSPLLLNIALHGMEEAAGVRYLRRDTYGVETRAGSPVLVRYADDFVVMCHTEEQAVAAWHRLGEWLAPRGLAINMDKTRVVHVEHGFDFLGCNIRRYRGKLLIKPSTAAGKRIRQRLAAEVRSLRGANADAVIRRLNPIIRGWSAYYRSVVSKEVFAAIDHYLWRHTYGWALRAHPNKSRHWVVNRYFGMFNPSRQDRWVFGDRASGAYLRRFAWTKIVRHRLVMGTASPDDAALDRYWAERRRKTYSMLGGTSASLLLRQQGRCPACGTLLLDADHEPQTPQEWEQWIMTIVKALRKNALTTDGTSGTADGQATRRLLHAHCRRREAVHRRRAQRRSAALRPRGLLEPDAVKVARPVLRGPGRSNASGLPDRVCHGFTATFDDPNLVSCAGLAPVLQLVERAGLQRLVVGRVRIGKPGGGNAHLKIPSLIAGMVAGADSIDDMALLRHGGTRRLFTGVRAPSTLGTFLRTFTFGHVRQLDAVLSRLLIKLTRHTPLLPGPVSWPTSASMTRCAGPTATPSRAPAPATPP